MCGGREAKMLGYGWLAETMLRAEPGWIDERSWEFWRGRLMRATGRSIPDAAPVRSFHVGSVRPSDRKSFHRPRRRSGSGLLPRPICGGGPSACWVRLLTLASGSMNSCVESSCSFEGDRKWQFMLPRVSVSVSRLQYFRRSARFMPSCMRRRRCPTECRSASRRSRGAPSSTRPMRRTDSSAGRSTRRPSSIARSRPMCSRIAI